MRFLILEPYFYSLLSAPNVSRHVCTDFVRANYII